MQDDVCLDVISVFVILQFQFRYLVEGYATTTPLQTLINIKRYVVAEKLLRGEGRVILQHVERVVSFNNASFGYSDHEAITDVVLDIVDAILAQNVSLNKEQVTFKLHNLILNTNSIYFYY